MIKETILSMVGKDLSERGDYSYRVVRERKTGRIELIEIRRVL